MNKHKDHFKLSKWTIKLKLVVINFLAIFLSLMVMIVLATYYFKQDSETRVKETGVQITDVIGSKVKSDFTSLTDKMKLVVTTLNQNFKNEEQRKVFISLFFKNDKDFLMLGVLEKKGENGLLPSKVIYNEEIIDEYQLKKVDIDTVLSTYKNLFLKATTGKAILKNVSPELKIPSFAVVLPYENEILLSLVHINKIAESFESKGGITTNFLVNDEGDVIAHPEEKVVLAARNLYDLPIVSHALTNKQENGQKNYTGKDDRFYYGSFRKFGFAGASVISIVLEDAALEAVYQIRRRNFIIMFITLSFAFLLIFNFANTITKPILTLVKSTKRIQRGEFSLNIEPTTRDEIGLLTDSFIGMGRGLAEREKVKDALARFVNPEIAEMALRDELKLGGERKDCVIFFSDIRSFTAISEKLEPEQVIEFLNEYMTEMVRCVNETGGTVDKYIGDAIMATWGVPISKGNDPENAINGTLMMRKALLEFNKNRGTVAKPIIKIGCGLNYGSVVAGQMGSKEKLQYTVIGDAVNLASRIEPLNKPFGTDILISQDLYDIVKDIFKVEKMKAIKVKGKEEPQFVYAVLGRLDDPTCPQNIEELRKLVGIDYKPEENKKKKADGEEEVKYEILE